MYVSDIQSDHRTTSHFRNFTKNKRRHTCLFRIWRWQNSNGSAKCTSHIISHETTPARLFLRAAVEASQNMSTDESDGGDKTRLWLCKCTIFVPVSCTWHKLMFVWMDPCWMVFETNVVQFYWLFLRHLSVMTLNCSHAGHIKQTVQSFCINCCGCATVRTSHFFIYQFENKFFVASLLHIYYSCYKTLHFLKKKYKRSRYKLDKINYSCSCLHCTSIVSKHFLLFQLMHTIIKS